ncbi:hypothetical protein QQX98_007917 [Neonectria punicea]|uniref:Uncharacterized protein n=1 Tax=Neonectria punicea TaxID=979145 RepID=A0ABR1GWZ0_9HYPO
MHATPDPDVTVEVVQHRFGLCCPCRRGSFTADLYRVLIRKPHVVFARGPDHTTSYIKILRSLFGTQSSPPFLSVAQLHVDSIAINHVLEGQPAFKRADLLPVLLQTAIIPPGQPALISLEQAASYAPLLCPIANGYRRERVVLVVDIEVD